MRKRRRWPGVLTGADLAALVLLYLIETFVAERHPLTTLVTYLPQWPFVVPAVLPLLAALLRRDRRLILLNAAAVLFGLVALLGFRFAPSQAAPKKRLVLRVLTFNIRHGEGGAGRIAAVIRDARPDVVCFQEANAFGRLPDPKPDLRRALSGYYFAENGELMIASRYPIRSRQIVPLNAVQTRRPALEAVLDVHGRPLIVIDAHLATFVTTASLGNRQGRPLTGYLRGTARLRAEQAEALLRRARAAHGPLVLAGDFNTPPRGRVYHRLAGALADAADRLRVHRRRRSARSRLRPRSIPLRSPPPDRRGGAISRCFAAPRAPSPPPRRGPRRSAAARAPRRRRSRCSPPRAARARTPPDR